MKNDPKHKLGVHKVGELSMASGYFAINQDSFGRWFIFKVNVKRKLQAEGYQVFNTLSEACDACISKHERIIERHRFYIDQLSKQKEDL